MCPAGSRAASTGFGRWPLRRGGVGARRGLRAGVWVRRFVLRRRSIGHGVPRRSQGADRDVRDRADEHCGVFISRWRLTAAVRRRADVGVVRRALRIDHEGRVQTLTVPFGRPQGLAFDARPACCTWSKRSPAPAACTRCAPAASPNSSSPAPGLIGLAFGPRGELVVASSGSVYSFPPTQ